MPITYTNRKGKTYVLCRGTTITGKPRYFFAREAIGDVVAALPEGYQIEEGVNGVVSLVKQRPQPITPHELTAVEAALQRHPKRANFAARIKGKEIIVYERQGLDVDALSAMFAHLGPLPRRAVEVLEESGQFIPVMRFVLIDRAQRVFAAERWHFSGSIDDWINIGHSGDIKDLARQLIPKLGTDAFFELG